MGKVLSYFSGAVIPVLVFYIVLYGFLKRGKVYEDFIAGAEKGFRTVVQIMPTLVGLMTAVGVLRASGFLDFFGGLLGQLTEGFGMPAELVPLIFAKMVSSSAATGLVLDIFRTFGADSRIGLIASVLMSCTETIFYTMSVYFMTVGVRKTRHTLAGALLATFAGVIASVILAELIRI